MARYIIAIAMLLLCVPPIGAQSTFAWAFDREIVVGADFIGTYRMYEIDVFSGDHMLLFSIHSDRFDHGSIEGLQFQIISFLFTEDRSKVYFLARDGDLYVYNIDTDELIYLQDLTPKTGSFLVHNIQNLFSLSWLNDSTIYCAGQTYLTYNIDDTTIDIIRETVDFPTAFSEFEQDILLRSYVTHKNNNLFLSNSKKMQQQLDIYNPEDVVTLADFSSANVPLIPIPIISYQHSCDSIELYLISSIAEVEIFRLDIDNELVVPVVSYPLYDDIDFIIDVEHYNEPDYDTCQRVIDLDGDDSSGAMDTDYYSDTLCVHTDIPIADIDVAVDNDLPLDSISVVLLDPQNDQYLDVPLGNYTMSGNGTAQVTIVQNGTTTLSDYATAISGTQYVDEANYREGTIEIQLQAWQGGLAGAIVTSYLYIANSAQNIENVALDYCQQDSMLLVDDDIPYSGYFYNEDGTLSPLTISLTNPLDSNYTFIIDAYCADTISVEVLVFAEPTVMGIADTLLCVLDTIMLEVDITSDSQILWSDGATSSTIEINSPGEYQYTITDINGCTVSDTFLIQYSDEATVMPVSIFVCPEEVSSYFDLQLSTPGNYEYRKQSVLGCDSIIHQIEFDYYPTVPMSYSSDLAFCEGDSILLEVISDHSNTTYNGQVLVDDVYINNDMPITVQGTDTYGCVITDTLYPIIYDNPIISVSDILDEDASQGIPIDVFYEGDITEYYWSPSVGLDCADCAFPTVTAAVDQVYIVDVITGDGCTDTDSLYIRTTEQQYFLPNVIAKSANVESNRSFYLISYSDVVYDLQIYDRWGSLIAERSRITANIASEGWIPSDQNIANGVYVYQVKIYNGTTHKIMVGDVTVL